MRGFLRTGSPMPRTALPIGFVEPMLPTLVDAPPDGASRNIILTMSEDVQR